MFGLVGWTIDRFVARRTRLHELQYEATKMRERSVLSSLAIVAVANVIVLWSLASAVLAGHLQLGAVVVFAQAAIGTSMIAFGGLNWALDGSAAPVAAVLRLKPAMGPAGALTSGERDASGLPAREIRFRDLTFGYPTTDAPRALCAVQLGAGVVLLDEPTAQLDVRGEAEIFDRILAATRQCTTILISHRFSTVRHADRICVLEHGAVVELGTHDELISLGGRYRTMFDLQAQRFAAGQAEEGEEEVTFDVLA